MIHPENQAASRAQDFPAPAVSGIVYCDEYRQIKKYFSKSIDYTGTVGV